MKKASSLTQFVVVEKARSAEAELHSVYFQCRDLALRRVREAVGKLPPRRTIELPPPSPEGARRPSLMRRGGSRQPSKAMYPEDDVEEATTELERRAKPFLQELRKSAFFKDVSSDLLNKLSSLVSFQNHHNGTVLFRQGDPPENCYLVIEGKAGVFVKPSRQRGDVSPRVTSATAKHFVRTVEGHSFYSEKLGSKLGVQVHQIGVGGVFGELALQTDRPRSATIICLEACEFLVIEKGPFRELLKAEIEKETKRKMAFLNAVIPELQAPSLCADGSPDPHFFFDRRVLPKGEVLLKQGVLVEGFGVNIVIKGKVRLTRSIVDPMSLTDELVDRTCDVLGAGDVFGCLPIEPRCPEPFGAVVASDSCEVYQCLGKKFQQIPRRLRESIMETVAAATAERLQFWCCNRKRAPRLRTTPSDPLHGVLEDPLSKGVPPSQAAVRPMRPRQPRSSSLPALAAGS